MSLNKSRIYDRLKLTNSQDLTIPESATLFCAGGGIFQNGIVIGNNNSVIPGTIKYNSKLEYLKNNEWVTLIGHNNNNYKQNSILLYDENGNVIPSDISIENKDIIGAESIEVESIISPDSKNLTLNNILWPSTLGETNRTLIFTDPYTLNISDKPVLLYNVDSESNRLLYLDDNKNIISSDIEIEDGRITANILEVNNSIISLILVDNTLKTSSSSLILQSNSKITNISNDIKNVYGIISFCVEPPATSKSSGEKGDFAWDENYLYMCVSNNKWKRIKYDEDNW